MSLYSHFEKIPEFRRLAGLRTDLAQILCMSVLSYLCGHTGYRGIHRFCRNYADLLIEELSLRHGIPSHVTFYTVLKDIDESVVIGHFNDWASSLDSFEESEWLSADGKTLCSTVSDAQGKGQNFQAVVSLFAQESGLVHLLGEYRNKGKDKGEIDVLRFLMEQLGRKGAIIRVDALHTQKKRLNAS